MSYENAPQTKLLATDCAVCARPLCDAKSVELGIGPECRKKYGFNIEVTEEARRQANEIVHQIALNQKGEGVAHMCASLKALGFETLADVIIDRVADIRVVQLGDMLKVFTPYDANAAQAFRSIPGRRWVPDEKANTFPVRSKMSLLVVLKKHFAGRVGVGPKGAFTL